MKNVEILPSKTTICQKFRKYIFLAFMHRSEKEYVMKGIDKLHDHIDIQKWKNKDVFYQHNAFINCRIAGKRTITKRSTKDSEMKQAHINSGIDFYTDKVQLKTDNIRNENEDTKTTQTRTMEIVRGKIGETMEEREHIHGLDYRQPVNVIYNSNNQIETENINHVTPTKTDKTYEKEVLMDSITDRTATEIYNIEHEHNKQEVLSEHESSTSYSEDDESSNKEQQYDEVNNEKTYILENDSDDDQNNAKIGLENIKQNVLNEPESSTFDSEDDESSNSIGSEISNSDDSKLESIMKDYVKKDDFRNIITYMNNISPELKNMRYMMAVKIKVKDLKKALEHQDIDESELGENIKTTTYHRKIQNEDGTLETITLHNQKDAERFLYYVAIDNSVLRTTENWQHSYFQLGDEFVKEWLCIPNSQHKNRSTQEKTF